MAFDSVIIGGGPAAVSAALTLRNRNKTVAIVTGGVDDIPLCRYTTPPLATIRQNRLDLGKCAFNALSSLLAGVPLSSCLLHAELVRRASVGAPNLQRKPLESREYTAGGGEVGALCLPAEEEAAGAAAPQSVS